MASSPRARVVAAFAAALAACPAVAAAAGFEFSGNSAMGLGRGMALTASADDGTAVAHNPGLLSRQTGLRLSWSHQLIWSHETFTRAPSQVAQKDIAGVSSADALKPSDNQTPLFPLGAFLTASYQLDPAKGIPLTFAFAGYGPSAVGSKEFAVQGGQRYMLTKLDALMAYLTLSAAWGNKDRWGVGLSLQYAVMPRTDMSLVVDGATGGPQYPYYAPSDVVATIRLKDYSAFSAIAGAWLRISPNLDVAASGRVIPISFNAEGDLQLANDKDGAGAAFKPNQLAVTHSKASLALKIAPTAAVGARWRALRPDGGEAWDVEANVVWEGWSVLNDYQVRTSGTINLFAAQNTPEVITIGKRWRDTLAVRLGGTWWANDRLGVSLGGYVEQGATPVAYSHLDFPSFGRHSVGGGLRWRGERLAANLSYGHVFQETREVSEQYGKVLQQRPLAPCPQGCSGFGDLPANAGTFASGYDLVSWSATWAF